MMFQSNHYLLQNNFESESTKNILSTWENDTAPNKCYQGDKCYQREKGAKWYHWKKKPMEKEPEK